MMKERERRAIAALEIAQTVHRNTHPDGDPDGDRFASDQLERAILVLWGTLHGITADVLNVGSSSVTRAPGTLKARQVLGV